MTVSWICAAIMCVVSVTPLIASPTLASEAAFRCLSIAVICAIVIVSLALMQKRLSPLEFALMAVGGCAVPALLSYHFHSQIARHPV